MSSLYQQLDSHTVHSGWLYKKGWYNTSWKKRYFMLYDDRAIHYFAPESHSLNQAKAKGKIHLTQTRRVKTNINNAPQIQRIRKNSPKGTFQKLPLSLSDFFDSTQMNGQIKCTISLTSDLQIKVTHNIDLQRLTA
eukprot:32531_1